MAGRKVGKSTDANNNDESLADDDVFFPLVLEERADGAPKHEKIFMHR